MVARTGGNDPIERDQGGEFRRLFGDAGVVTSSPGFAAFLGRPARDGAVIGFNYQNVANLTGTQSTQLLVVQTNATNYMGGLMSVQYGQAANGVGFQPAAATLEPISMSLPGGGLALLGAARLRRNTKLEE